MGTSGTGVAGEGAETAVEAAQPMMAESNYKAGKAGQAGRRMLGDWQTRRAFCFLPGGRVNFSIPGEKLKRQRCKPAERYSCRAASRPLSASAVIVMSRSCYVLVVALALALAGEVSASNSTCFVRFSRPVNTQLRCEEDRAYRPGSEEPVTVGGDEAEIVLLCNFQSTDVVTVFMDNWSAYSGLFCERKDTEWFSLQPHYVLACNKEAPSLPRCTSDFTKIVVAVVVCVAVLVVVVCLCICCARRRSRVQDAESPVEDTVDTACTCVAFLATVGQCVSCLAVCA